MPLENIFLLGIICFITWAGGEIIIEGENQRTYP